MDVQSLIGEFLGSQHAQGAMGALAQAGIDPGTAPQLLSVAAEAGGNHVEKEGAGLLGENPGKSFFAAFASGLVKGDGVFGSLEDGAEGVLVGRITEALCDKCGVDSATASTIAAAVTPYVSSFLKSKLSSN
ncbi:MAG TPA: hypothetical protein VIF09_11530 [Polyangiaceae bacterium]